jgi:hypothetical protein
MLEPFSAACTRTPFAVYGKNWVGALAWTYFQSLADAKRFASTQERQASIYELERISGAWNVIE